MAAACPACGDADPGDGKFCTACGASLSTNCANCGTPLRPGRPFCGECGKPVAATAAPTESASTPEGERKQLTVLFADVQGSMELQQEVDVETWAGIVDRFVHVLADSVHRFGGTVDKFTGDGIMALFGAPEAQEDHARRACHAAWHMARAIRVFGEELRASQGVDLQVRIGLNSGEVVVGRVGEDLRIDPTALGHAVGLAQRMEALAVGGATYLTEHTARLAEGWFRLRDLGPMTVKGSREPMRVFALEGPEPPRTRTSAGRAGATSSLVGRSTEMAILEDALSRAAEGRAQVVGVVGEPGVGKSRLCEEFVRSALLRGISVRRTSGVSHGREVPLLPILAYFRDYFGITEAISPAQARERISDRLLGLDPSFDADLPLFFDFLEVPHPERPAPAMAAESRMRRIFEVLRRVTARRSERELAILLLEDLHWFDPQSAGFLERLIENFPGSRTLVVTNFRPEFSAAWMRHSYYRQIPLLPLTPNDVGEMLGELLGADLSLRPVAPYVAERTAGNPFFVEEVVRAMVEDGSLEGDPGAYRLSRPLEKAGLPASVQAVLAARIDRLAAEHKPVLQSASVIGRTFAETVLARVMGEAVEKLARSLSALCAAELVQEAQRYPTAEYRFWHPLTQEVAYSTMLSARRARLHAVVAEALIELDAERLDEQAAMIAWHWEQADRHLEAARWGMRAADFALRSDLAAALDRWQAILRLLERVPETEESLSLGVRARMRLLRYGLRVGMQAQELERLEYEARQRAERLGDPRLSVLMAFSSASVRLFTGEITAALTRYVEAEHRGEAIGDREMVAGAAFGVGFVTQFVGSAAEALGWADRALDMCGDDPDFGSAVWSYGIRGPSLCVRAEMLAIMGRLADAAADAKRATEILRVRRDPEWLCYALTLPSKLAWLSGGDDDGSSQAAEAVQVAEDTGNAAFTVVALQAVALSHLTAGRAQQAAAVCERALAMGRAKRSGLWTESSLLAYLARARLETGDGDAAILAADEALAVARRQGAEVLESLALLTRAQVGRALGRAAAAAVDLAAALKLAIENGALTYEPFIREERGRLHGDGEDLREALRLHEAVGATGRARRLRRELEGSAVAPP